MTFDQVIEAVNGKILVRGMNFDRQTIEHVMVSDLMSDVLVTEDDDILLVTSLPSDQVARTADMVGACGLVLVNGKAPQTALLDLCQEMGLTLIETKLSSFEASYCLGRWLLSRT